MAPGVVAAFYVVAAIAGCVTNIVGGALVDRVPVRCVLPLACVWMCLHSDHSLYTPQPTHVHTCTYQTTHVMSCHVMSSRYVMGSACAMATVVMLLMALLDAAGPGGALVGSDDKDGLPWLVNTCGVLVALLTGANSGLQGNIAGTRVCGCVRQPHHTASSLTHPIHSLSPQRLCMLTSMAAATLVPSSG